MLQLLCQGHHAVVARGLPCFAPGGSIMVGLVRPIHGLFDFVLEKQGTFQLKFSMPHSDLNLSDEEREKWFGSDAPIKFINSMENQLGSWLDAVFLIAGLYEDHWGGGEPIDLFVKSFVAVRAIKSIA